MTSEAGPHGPGAPAATQGAAVRSAPAREPPVVLDDRLRARVSREDFCPYRGLDPYDEEHRVFFKGRDTESGIIAANLYAASLTVLYGPSGAGKTSILQAGVVPELRGLGAGIIVQFREWQTPGFAKTLKERILAHAAGHAALPGGLNAGERLDEILRQCARATGVPLFLIFDQFEEYFLYHPASEGAEGFEADFARAVNQRGGAGNFLVCMREEELSKLDRFRTRIPHLLSNLLRLKPLDWARALDAIRQPLQIYNHVRRSLDRPGAELQEGLAEELLREEVSFEQQGSGRLQEGEHAVELPFLQLVLTRLWAEEGGEGPRRLRVDTLRRLGGAAGVVREHVNASLRRPTLARLAAAALGRSRAPAPAAAEAGKGAEPLTARELLQERRIVADAFEHLVTPSGTKIAHTAGDLARFTRASPVTVGKILRRLSGQGNRILKQLSGGRGGEDRYELAHDALAPAILDWRARYERERRRRRMAAFSLLFALLVLGVAGYFAAKAAEANRQILIARSERMARDARWIMREDPLRGDSLARAAFAAYPGRGAIDALRRGRFDDRLVATLTSTEGGYTAAVRALAFSRDGRYLASGGEDSTTVLWDAAVLQRLRVIPQGDIVYDVAFDTAGTRMVVAGRGKTARVWAVPGGDSVAAFPGHTEAVNSAVFSPDGARVFTASEDTYLREWNVATGRERLPRIVVGSGQNPLRSVDVDADGGRVAAGKLQGIVVNVDLQPRLTLPQGSRAQGPISRVRFSPDGSRIAAASRDFNAYVFAWQASRPDLVMRHSDWVTDVAWSPDGSLLATGSRDGAARIWDVRTGAMVAKLRGHRGFVNAVAFSPDGALLATGDGAGAIRLWRVAPLPVQITQVPDITGQTVCTTAGAFVLSRAHDELITAARTADSFAIGFAWSHGITVTPDGRWFVAAEGDGGIALRSTHPPDSTVLGTAPGDPGADLAFVQDRWVVRANADGTMLVFDCDVCRDIPSEPPDGWSPPPPDRTARAPSRTPSETCLAAPPGG